MRGYYFGDIYEHLEYFYFSLYSRHDMQTSSAIIISRSVSNHTLASSWATNTDASTVELPREAGSLRVILPAVEKLRSSCSTCGRKSLHEGGFEY